MRLYYKSSVITQRKENNSPKKRTSNSVYRKLYKNKELVYN